MQRAAEVGILTISAKSYPLFISVVVEDCVLLFKARFFEVFIIDYDAYSMY